MTMKCPDNPWAQLLGVQASAPVDESPLARLARIEKSSTSDPASPEDWEWLRDSLRRALAGDPPGKAFGFVATRGKRSDTPRGRLIKAQRQKVAILLIPASAENAHQAAEAVIPVVSGNQPPPTAEVASALEELRKLRGEFPKSKSGVLSIVAAAFSVKS